MGGSQKLYLDQLVMFNPMVETFISSCCLCATRASFPAIASLIEILSEHPQFVILLGEGREFLPKFLSFRGVGACIHRGKVPRFFSSLSDFDGDVLIML